MYHYLGNERLQFAFFSPNVCAAFLVVTALLTAGVFLLLVSRRGVLPKIGAGFFGVAVQLQFLMIAVTYSRGGYLACFAALTAAACCCRRRWSWALPVIFLAIVLLTGDGPSRIRSAGDLGDGSIRNRLLLWHYGTGVIAGHWAAGTSEPGAYYTRYYQPLWLNENYYSLISDVLTFAAMYGIFALFAALSILCLLLQYGFRLWLATRNTLLLYALAALAGYLVAGGFTTCYYFPSILAVLGALLLLIAGFLVWGFRTKKFRRGRFDLWPAPALAGAFCIGLLGYGAIVNATQPYSWKTVAVAGREVTILSPRTKSGKTLFILASGSGGEFRDLLRSLAERGFSVATLPIDIGFGELPTARRMLAELSRQAPNSFLIGVGEERAMQAIALADTDGPAGVIAVDPPSDWPFEELSPRIRLEKARVPVSLILSCESTEKAEQFRALIQGRNIPVEVILLPDSELADLAALVEKTGKTR